MTNFFSTMQAGTKYMVCCLSQWGMELKIVLPNLTHYSDGHFAENNLKDIFFKGFCSHTEEICCLFPEAKKIFVDLFFYLPFPAVFIRQS